VGVCIDILRRARKPAVLVPGNNESLDELRSACQGWHDAAVLHGTGTELLGVQFFGLGGGVPVTPFGPWSWDLPEAEAMKLLERCPAAAVLVSHSPPQGVVDRSSSGKNLGSTSVRDAVMRSRPRLVVCGHIHASGGQTGMLGTSPVVNAGPAGMIWTL
jgi:Icc-related predicted phosphoesterase